VRRTAAIAALALALALLLPAGCAEFGVPIPGGQGDDPPVQPAEPGPGPSWEPVWDDAFAMEVVEVVDGDTLRLRIERENDVVTTTNPIAVRLIGIDTPEVYPEEECFGPEAEAVMVELAPPGTVLLVAPDVDSWDDYNRRLFYVWREDDGVFLNEAMALAGYAEVNRYPPNTTLQEVLQSAEDSARDARRGLWGACER